MGKTSAPEGEALLTLCVQLLGDKHVDDMRAYNVKGVSSITDYYLVGSIRNERQMKAAGQNLTRQLKRMGVHALHKDGELASNAWVVLDYLDCIVHLFSAPARQHYGIEQMWQRHPMDMPRLLAQAARLPKQSANEEDGSL